MEFISLHFPQLEPFLRNIFPPQFPTTITHFTYGSLCFLEKARILKERKSHYSKFPTTWTITSLLPQLLSVSICFPEDFPQLLLFFFCKIHDCFIFLPHVFYKTRFTFPTMPHSLCPISKRITSPYSHIPHNFCSIYSPISHKFLTTSDIFFLPSKISFTLWLHTSHLLLILSFTFVSFSLI